MPLLQYFGDAEAKGGKMVSKPTTIEGVLIKEAKRESELLTLQKIMTTPVDEWPKDGREQQYQLAQRVRAVRFLLDGPGKTHKLLKDFVPRYMKATIAAGEAWLAENPVGVPAAQAKTVEEEEAQAKSRSEAGERKHRFILEKVNAECCKFSDKDWDQLNRAFAKYLLE